MSAEDHKKHSRENIGFALVVVSDSKTEETDTSGALIQELIKADGHRVISYKIVKDDPGQITDEAERALAVEDINAVIFCGGTGVSSRDVTIETIRPMFQKELTGFGEIFRAMSTAEIGSAAIMSRATAGVTNKKVLFCIPGSRGAVDLAMKKLILEECGHILWEVNR